MVRGNGWLIKCCCVLKADVYGFLRRPGAARGSRVPLSPSARTYFRPAPVVRSLAPAVLLLTPTS